MLRPPSSVRRAPGRRRGCRWLGHDRFLTRGGRRRGRGRRAAGGDSKGTNCQGRRQKDEVFHSWFGWLQPPFGGQRVNSRIERKLFAISPLGFFQSETVLRSFFRVERLRFPSRMRRLSARGRGEFCRRTFSRCAFSAARRWRCRSSTAARRRSRASLRFIACDRESCTVTLSPLGRCRRVTAVETLFTFCPPGPPERANVSSRSASRSSIAI